MSRKKVANQKARFAEEDYILPHKRRYRSQDIQQNVVDIKPLARRRKDIVISPKTLKQEEYLSLLLDPTKLIVFATGPAGTGKTMMAVLAALKAFKEGTTERIIITRPAVGVDDEKHGFLPGTLNEKMEPWVQPIFDVMKEYYSPREIALMLEEETLLIEPLAYMRGRTFKNSWIIFDEAQNSTSNQMKMALTRIGDNSRMVVTGDLNQLDRKFASENGLRDFISMLKESKSKMIDVVDFGNKDVMRHPVVKEVLNIYGEL